MLSPYAEKIWNENLTKNAKQVQMLWQVESAGVVSN